MGNDRASNIIIMTPLLYLIFVDLNSSIINCYYINNYIVIFKYHYHFMIHIHNQILIIFSGNVKQMTINLPIGLSHRISFI